LTRPFRDLHSCSMKLLYRGVLSPSQFCVNIPAENRRGPLARLRVRISGGMERLLVAAYRLWNKNGTRQESSAVGARRVGFEPGSDNGSACNVFPSRPTLTAYDDLARQQYIAIRRKFIIVMSYSIENYTPSSRVPPTSRIISVPP
jgi:hypothetical protein